MGPVRSSLAFVLMFTLWMGGCGTERSLTPTSPVPVQSSQPASPPQSKTYLYVSDAGNDSITVFRLDETTGVMSDARQFPAPHQPGALAISADGKFLFNSYGWFQDSGLSVSPDGFSAAGIDKDGGLSDFSPDLVPAFTDGYAVGSPQVVRTAIHPTRDFGYQVDGYSLRVYARNGTQWAHLSSLDTLLPQECLYNSYTIVGFVGTSPEPSLILYHSNYCDPDFAHGPHVAVLSLRDDGGIASVTEKELSNAGSTVAVGGSYVALSELGTGTTLYGVINGELQAVASCSQDSATCPYMTNLAVSPDGKFLFGVESNSKLIWTMQRIDTALVGSGNPSVTADVFDKLFVGPADKFLFATHWTANSIAVYRIGDQGRLDPVAGSPYVTGVNPAGMVSFRSQ